jgi:large subunit ribosomal protein L24
MQQTKRVKNPSKQRKMHFNAPAHIRHKFMSAPLSKELVASRGTKTLPVRKGDTVRIQRGDNKGFEGKVSRVDTKAYRIYIEGLTREKVDGTNIFLSTHPSKVQIRNLNLDDNWRKDILSRKKGVEKPERKEKPKATVAKKAAKAPAKTKEQLKEEKEIEEAFKEEAAPETAKEEAPEPKKAPEKKAAAKKPAAKEEAPAKEETTPKKAAKKAPAAKETAAKEVAPKPRAKKKTSEGGQ